MPWRALLATSALIMLAGPAAAYIHGSAVIVNCPQAIDNGCAAAVMAGGLWYAPTTGGSWGAFARQSGQAWVGGNHPWNWNSPGIDTGYGLGPSETMDSAVDPAVSQPAHCTYSATGFNGGERLLCASDGGVGIDVARYNFGLRNGILLEIASSVTGQCVIEHNYFKTGTTTYVANSGLIVFDFNGTCQLTEKNNYLDGNFANFHTGVNFNGIFDKRNVSTTTIHQYSVYFQMPGIPVKNQILNPVTIFRYNYSDGACYDAGDTGFSCHAEIMVENPGLTGLTLNTTYTGNVILWPLARTTNTGSANFYTSTGTSTAASGMTWQTAHVDHNVIVVNNGTTPGTGLPGKQMGSAIAAQEYNIYDDFTLDTNYVDLTGANFCAQNAAGPPTGPAVASPTLTGNVSLTNGSAITAVGVAVGSAGCN